MFNLEEMKIIEIIQEHQSSLFRKKIKFQKNQTESLAFSIEKTCCDIFMIESIKANFDYPISYTLSKIHEYEFVAFFGNGRDITGTHLLLKDPRKFWSIFTFLIHKIQYPSLYLKQIEESLTLYKRMKVPLTGRNYSAYCLLLTDLFWEKNSNYLLKINNLEDVASLSDILSIFNSDVNNLIHELILKSLERTNRTNNKKTKTVTVFRGFDISKTENVRKNRFKKNNFEAQQQDAGFGVSYSYNKEIAKDFSKQKFDAASFILLNTIRDRVSIASFSLSNSRIKSDDFLDISKRTPYVGKYELHKDDILVDISDFAEEEVIALPSKVKLLDYRPSKYS